MQNNYINENYQENAHQVAGFVGKTFQILNLPDFVKIIYWSSNGTQFTIKDVVKFQQLVLPKYFRHNKMNSFVRQLNMYGFHKTKHNNFKSTFKHPNFQKGKEQLLPLVKRKLKFTQQNEQKAEQVQVIVNKCQIIQKQPEITSVSLEKYFSFSNQSIGTTKMINFSLKKLSFNDFNNLQNLQQQPNQDFVSIQDEIQVDFRNEELDFFNFQNVSCFFSSNFNM